MLMKEVREEKKPDLKLTVLKKSGIHHLGY
jgi:hypothetical protein